MKQPHKIERWYQEDNCRSKNEFIEKAVNCYADMLAAGESTTLPRAVQSAIDARLKLFEDRIASLLYKQAVEMDMAMSILLQSLNVSEEVLRQERAKSIAAVKRTNGQLRLEQKLREHGERRMARLIVKSPYIKCGTGQSAGGYLKYIATRERVEIIPDDRPPTNKQDAAHRKAGEGFS